MSAAEYHIVIEKQARTLAVYRRELLERSYPVVLGRNWAADKTVEGDEATPIGEFYICTKNPRSKSSCPCASATRMRPTPSAGSRRN